MMPWDDGEWGRGRRPGRRGRRPGAEGLESRCLLAVTVNEFPVPTANSAPLGIVTGSDGNLWFTEQFGNKIGQINPTTQAIAEFPIPTAGNHPTNITSGPDGNLWFVEENSNNGRIGTINPTTHAIAEFPVPTAGSSIGGITTGPDGNLWFTEAKLFNVKIGMINPATHAIAEFPTPTPDTFAGDITTGPDGNLWFTESSASANKIGMFNPTTHAIAEFPVPTARSEPDNITAGPDGNLWFTESQVNQVGMINPTTHVIVEFPAPTAGSGPLGITSGPDGNLYFTEINADQIGRINPTTHVITEFPVPNAGESLDLGITTGPDRNIWFGIPSANAIGQLVFSTAPTATATRTHLSATPNPSTVGQQVTFTAVVSALTGTAVPAGTVTFTVDGAAQTPVRLAAVGGRDQAVFSTSSLTAGAHTIGAVYNPQGNFSVSSDGTRQAVNAAPEVTDGPRVLALQRYGYHAQPTTLVVSFDSPLVASTARLASNYVIIGPAGGVIPVSAVSYNPFTSTVTLLTARRLDLHFTYTLVINGTGPLGVRGTSGLLLDGRGTGQPGSNFVTSLTAADLVVTPGPGALAALRLSQRARAGLPLF